MESVVVVVAVMSSVVFIPEIIVAIGAFTLPESKQLV